MVDNRGISPLSTTHFKSDNASANKMSEEKYGQGGEYFANEMQEEEQQEERQSYQDRSAQLRASLNGLAAANAGAIRVMKVLQEKEEEKKKKRQLQQEEKEKDEFQEELLD